MVTRTSRRVRGAFASLLLAVMVLGVFATTALAQVYPPPPPGITITVTPSPTGVFLTGTGFQPGEDVFIQVSVTPLAAPAFVLASMHLQLAQEGGPEVIYEGTHTTNAEGELNEDIPIPAEYRDMPLVFTISAESTGTFGTAPILVDDDGVVDDGGDDGAGEPVEADDDALPRTGMQIGLAAVIGLGLLTVGLMTLRRRERHDDKVDVGV